MSGLGDVTNGDRRTQLEQRAAAVRSRLEERLEALDERRDRMVNIAKTLTRPPASVVILGVAGAVAAALIVRSLRPRRPDLAQQLARALAARAPRRADGFFKRALKRAALSVVAAAVQSLSTRRFGQLLVEPGSRVAVAVPRPGPR